MASTFRMVVRSKQVAPDSLPEVHAGVITPLWLRKYGVDFCVFDLHNPCETEKEVEEINSKSETLANKLLVKLNDNGVFYVSQVESLSMHGQLNDVLECVGVSHAIAETFDRKDAALRRKKPVRSFLRSLAGNLTAMESMCQNYGLSAALVLTMTFANFGSVTTEDWIAYLVRIELTNPRCQAMAVAACEADPEVTLESMRSENILAYWSPVYCQTAMLDLVQDPALDISAPTDEYPYGRGCCMSTLRCAIDASWNMELAFTIGCGAGTALLLLVVLYTSWLYITINATKVNKARWHEARLLTKRLSNHFLVLQMLFATGILLAYLGVFSVVGMKTTTYNLSSFCIYIINASGIIAISLAVKILRDIYTINAKIDDERKEKKDWSQRTAESKRKDVNQDVIVPWS